MFHPYKDCLPNSVLSIILGSWHGATCNSHSLCAWFRESMGRKAYCCKVLPPSVSERAISGAAHAQSHTMPSTSQSVSLCFQGAIFSLSCTKTLVVLPCAIPFATICAEGQLSALSQFLCQECRTAYCIGSISLALKNLSIIFP